MSERVRVHDTSDIVRLQVTKNRHEGTPVYGRLVGWDLALFTFPPLSAIGVTSSDLRLGLGINWNTGQSLKHVPLWNALLCVIFDVRVCQQCFLLFVNPTLYGVLAGTALLLCFQPTSLSQCRLSSGIQ